MTANRFRFRAWYPAQKHMDTCFHLFAGSGKACIFSHDTVFPLIDSNGDDAIVMQSTGLTDKNGKEIFEGDILTWDGFTRAVQWDDKYAAWCFRPYMGTAVCVAMHNNRAEIVGNIHEHPHLLTTQAAEG